MATPLTYGAYQAVMVGSILSPQRCPVCNSTFKHVETKGLFCPNHPNIAATRFIVRFGKISRRFKNNYTAAYQFLTGLRFQCGSGQYDHRDYQTRKKPLGFSTLIDMWLEHKRQEMKPKSHSTIKSKLAYAQSAWGDVNAKDVDYGMVEDLLKSVPYKSKSKADLLAALKQFYGWMWKRHKVCGPEEWPVVKVEMEYRDTTDKATQLTILNDIKNHEPFRVWLGVKILSTYISIRPGELRFVKERHIDRERGAIIIPQPKDKNPKLILLLDEDIALFQTQPIGLPDLYFFRHITKIRGGHEGKQFGEHRFWKAWRDACTRLGVEGVSIYPGTKHTSAMELYRLGIATPEEIKALTGHAAGNKAFERYFRIIGKDLMHIVERQNSILKTDHDSAKSDHELITKNGHLKKIK